MRCRFDRVLPESATGDQDIDFGLKAGSARRSRKLGAGARQRRCAPASGRRGPDPARIDFPRTAGDVLVKSGHRSLSGAGWWNVFAPLPRVCESVGSAPAWLRGQRQQSRRPRDCAAADRQPEPANPAPSGTPGGKCCRDKVDARTVDRARFIFRAKMYSLMKHWWGHAAQSQLPVCRRGVGVGAQ